jgi:hypothetical protein
MMAKSLVFMGLWSGKFSSVELGLKLAKTK